MKFDVILADPPWFYNDRRQNGKGGFGGGAGSHYPLMKTKDICALPVNEIAADNSILFMWATYPNLPDALKVIEAWGFKYKTIGFQWVKTNADKGIIDYYNKLEYYPNDPMVEGMIKNKPFPFFKGVFFGVGYYSKSNTECCLIATRGKPLKPSRNDIGSVILAPRRKHSKKPWETHMKIKAMYPDKNCVELFAREPKDGWHVWGNEVDSTIII